MDNKAAIREKILSNNFTRKDYSVFKRNMKTVKKMYHPNLTSHIDLPEAITQMAEDSTKIRGGAPIYVILFLMLLFGNDKTEALIYITVMTIVMLIVLWTNASQRSLPISTDLRLMKLAFRMRKILKARTREEKARIKAEKKRKRAK